jgi:hypothetical protein
MVDLTTTEQLGFIRRDKTVKIKAFLFPNPNQGAYDLFSLPELELYLLQSFILKNIKGIFLPHPNQETGGYLKINSSYSF